ncbi:hypothetical protein F4782DRAFT_533048 [Xylaria castorea]|nr:hypothetical protein F4782DRAFT_533048 [Xylaria castorea]
MKFALTLIAYPIAVVAASASKATQSRLDGPFTASILSPSIINAAVNASDGKFYINKPTKTYCPGNVVDCSEFDGSNTVFIMSYDSRLGLENIVAGVYIAQDGSLSFTQAHSAAIPPESTVTGFSREQGIKPNESYLRIADREWVICPVSHGPPEKRTYQIFAYVYSLGNCFNAEIKTYDSDPS